MKEKCVKVDDNFRFRSSRNKDIETVKKQSQEKICFTSKNFSLLNAPKKEYSYRKVNDLSDLDLTANKRLHDIVEMVFG